MNYIFAFLIILSLIVSFINGTVDETINAGIEGARGSIELVLSFAGIMCMWSGFLKLAEEGGALDFILKIIRPVTKLLFPKLDKNSEALKHIGANISANLLGVGNAATPAGIAAMNELDKQNQNPLVASDEMSIFTVLNTASIQLIPTTIIALRASFGSKNPESIILPVWISSLCAVICAVSLMKIINNINAKKVKLAIGVKK